MCGGRSTELNTKLCLTPTVPNFYVLKIVNVLVVNWSEQMSHLIRYWMDHYPEDFKGSSPLLEQVAELQETMKDNSDRHLVSMLSMDSL